MSAALQDHLRAVVIGERSYGKGSIQGIFPLETGGVGMRLTTAKFYSPNGHPYSGIGVEPHLAVHTVARPAGGLALDLYARRTGDRTSRDYRLFALVGPDNSSRC